LKPLSPERVILLETEWIQESAGGDRPEETEKKREARLAGGTARK
jgi:hypothetical protein